MVQKREIIESWMSTKEKKIMISNNNQLLAEIDSLHERKQQMPLRMPISVSENPNLQQKKKKGSTRKRAFTGAKASER